MKFALIKDGEVLTVVRARSAAEIPGTWDLIVEVPPGSDAIGPKFKTEDGVNFTRPLRTFIPRESFLRRMTDDERADMELASVPVEGDTQGKARQRALVAQFLRYLDATVDLVHPSMNGVRGALVALGVLSGARVAEIFDPR